jgi:EpsI family protein
MGRAMDAERRLLVGLALALVFAGVVSWYAVLGPSVVVSPDSLRNVPLELSHWKGHEIPVDGAVERMLDADFNLQRAYGHALGDVVWLYVGYYGTERGGRPEHTPWVCYPSNGWTIVRQSVVRSAHPGNWRANELLIDKDGERRLVHFWYQSHRRTGMLGGFEQAVDRVLGRLMEGRADGSLVRLSTPLAEPGEETAARARLLAFGGEMLPFLVEHWPTEERGSSPPPS